MNQREKDLLTKQEGGTRTDHKALPASSRLWTGLKNPRIVCVSRAFGGKDRHSKVSTIRGLRDRRVRLSVQTAIQLYNLQDKLGLNQPSKVVGWLLNAAQHEIDKLPPLQIPPENFAQFTHEALQAPSHPLNAINFGFTVENGSRPISSLLAKATASHEDLNSNDLQRIKQREDLNTTKNDEGAQISPHEPFQRSSISGFLSNVMPYTSYYQWEEATNAYNNLSQLGLQSSTQAEASLNAPSHSSQPGSQVVLCSSVMMPLMFSSYVATPQDFDARLQMASSFSHPQYISQRNLFNLGNPSARSFQ